MQDEKKRLIPKYAIVPIAGMLILNFFTYFVTPLWTNNKTHYCMEIGIDEHIPLIAIFIVPYFLAYAQWVIGFVAIAGTSKEHCNRILYGEMIAKVITCVLFFVIPTTMNRAAIENTDVFSWLVSFLYSIDEPVNLFPSIHCLESWICLRGMSKEYFSNKWRVPMAIMTGLVFLSIVFVKQHVFVDMLGAVVVAEIGLFISGRIKGQQEND